jgi:signal peptidase II
LGLSETSTHKHDVEFKRSSVTVRTKCIKPADSFTLPALSRQDTRPLTLPSDSLRCTRTMTPARRIRITLLIVALVSTVGCDQTSKHIARGHLDRFDSVTVLHGFGHLELTENPGAFLSLGAAFPPSVRTIIFTLGTGAGLVALLGCLARHTKLSWVAFAGLALGVSGGSSNLIDRITRHGLVTDFIALRLGPFHTGIFNFADVAIMVGAGLLTHGLWKQKRSAASKAPPTARSRVE